MKKFRKFVPHVVSKTWYGFEDSRDILACAVSLKMALRDAAGPYPQLRCGLPVIIIINFKWFTRCVQLWVGNFLVIYVVRYVLWSLIYTITILLHISD